MKYLFVVSKNKKVVQAKSLEQWAKFTENKEKNCRVARTKISKQIEVSTVFLGVSVALASAKTGKVAKELFFETMIFTNGSPNVAYRAETWKEAEMMHKKIVAELKARKLKTGIKC